MLTSCVYKFHSLRYIDNKNKDILILSQGRTQGMHDTILTVEAKYNINFSQPRYINNISIQRERL